MPRYSMTIARTEKVTKTATVEINAASAEVARELALDQMACGEIDNWIEDEPECSDRDEFHIEPISSVDLNREVECAFEGMNNIPNNQRDLGWEPINGPYLNEITSGPRIRLEDKVAWIAADVGIHKTLKLRAPFQTFDTKPLGR
jgi:hypothetical protein